MKKNKILMMAVPILIILLGLIIYQYGYLKAKESLTLIKEEENVKADTLLKYMAAIAQQGNLEKKLTTLNDQRKADSAKLMTGDTFSLAAAAFQEMVKGIILGQGGIISSERIGKEEIPVITPGLPKEESKALKGGKVSKSKQDKSEEKRIFITINVSFDFVVPEAGALRDILFFIETKVPFLVIKELDCRVRNFKEPRELMVKLDVSALYEGK